MPQSPTAIDSQDGQRQESHPPRFADVFEEYQHPIYNYLLRMIQNQAEAGDLTQETFPDQIPPVSLWEKIQAQMD